MPKFTVKMPVAGWQMTIVEAENEEEAIDKAYDNGCLEMDDPEVLESNLEIYKRLIQGNVFRGDCDEAEAEEIEEEKDE